MERQLDNTDIVTRARAMATGRAAAAGRADLADDAAIVVTELVTNALLHGNGCTGVEIDEYAEGVRILVHDRSRARPVLGHATADTMTGRGMRIVSMLSARWGADVSGDSKTVWAEINGHNSDVMADVDEVDLLAMWDDILDDEHGEPRYHLELGDVPTDLLLAAKSHVDNVAREFALASSGALSGMSGTVPPHLASLLSAVVDRFSEARLSIKHQALAAARRGAVTTRLHLDLPAAAADAAQDYARALDELDAYSRARRLLTFETPPQHRVFRQWYIGELVAQLRAAAASEPAPPPVPFETHLLAELDRLVVAERAADRAARLYTVAAALATAATPEEVAAAVLNEGVAALGAAAGGLLLATDNDTLALPGSVGYDDEVVARLRSESRDAELPAAVALRTGTPVWLESRAERDERFPELAGLEASTVALCAVPLQVQGRSLGALRFSFNTPRLFDEEERRFVLTLAAQTAQALDRAQIQRARIDVSRRLQRSLLPPQLPDIPGVDIAAIYHPFGDGLDVGGDFYDVWALHTGGWGIAIGDVSGTGPEAAGLSARVRSAVRTLAMDDTVPAHLMARLNVAVLAATREEDRFCTAMFGRILVGATVTVELAGGGHPPAVVRRAAGGDETFVVGGSLLGVFEEPEVGTVSVALGPGDTLVVLTDGVLEARRHGELFDMARVRRVLEQVPGPASATAEALEEAVLRHAGGSLADDMAAIVLHVPALQ